MDIQYKIGDTITAKFKPAFQEEVIVTGVIREFKGDMICCNQVGTSKPFFCLAEEVIRTNLSNAAMNIQKQAFEAWFKEKYPEFNADIVNPDGDDRAVIGYAFAWSAWQAAQKVAVPDGFILMPKEPTQENYRTFYNAFNSANAGNTAQCFKVAYKAMIEAQEHSNG